MAGTQNDSPNRATPLLGPALGAKLYVPPVERLPPVLGTAETAPRAKPWQQLREGETEPERQRRLTYTCWRCGYFQADRNMVALDDHENSPHGTDDE